MTEHNEIRQLTADVDRMLQSPHDDISSESANESTDYLQLLKVVRLLAQVDFSTDSTHRLTNEYDTAMFYTQSQHTRYQFGFLKHRAWGVGAVMVVIMLMMILFPPLRSLAQDIWRYFERADEGTMTFEEIEFAYEHFTQSSYWLEPAQADTEFHIKEPPALYFRLEDVSYASTHGEAVSLSYKPRYDPTSGQSPYRGIFGLFIKQIYVGDQRVELTSMDSVGPDAVVEEVQIGQGVGEYVLGQWTTEDPESGTLTWTTDHYHQLRWQEDGILYKMVVGTLPDLTPDISPEQVRDTLIALAESLE